MHLQLPVHDREAGVHGQGRARRRRGGRGRERPWKAPPGRRVSGPAARMAVHDDRGVGERRKYREYFYVPGWYASGDQAYRDEDSYIWFLGRADDVIKTSGAPGTLRGGVRAHRTSGRRGIGRGRKTDELRGEIVKAFIVLRPGSAPRTVWKEDITNFVRVRLATCLSQGDRVRGVLPKTRSGKICAVCSRPRRGGHDLGDLSMLED